MLTSTFATPEPGSEAVPQMSPATEPQPSFQPPALYEPPSTGNVIVVFGLTVSIVTFRVLLQSLDAPSSSAERTRQQYVPSARPLAGVNVDCPRPDSSISSVPAKSHTPRFAWIA